MIINQRTKYTEQNNNFLGGDILYKRLTWKVHKSINKI